MINKKNVKNFFFLSFSEGISGLLFLIAMIYCARILGPDLFGKISVARSIILYFLLIVNAGLDIYGIREGARDHASIQGLIGRIVPLRLILSAGTFILLAIMLQIFPRDMETRQLTMVFSGMIFFTAISIEWYLQCTERMALSAFGRLLSEVIFIGTIFYFVRSPGQLLWIPVARVLGMFFQQLFYWIINIKESGFCRFKASRKQWKIILKTSFPMGFGMIMVQIYYYLDSLMLGVLSNYENAGLYAAEYRLLISAIVITSMLNKALYPRLSTLYKTSIDQMTGLVNDALRYLAIGAGWIVFHGLLLASQGIIIIYGQEYAQSIPVFRMLIINLYAVVLNGLLGHGILAADSEKQYMIGVSLGAIVNFLLNLILIVRYGIYGAAVSTILAEIVVLYYFYRVYKSKKILISWGLIGKIYLTGIAVSVFVFMLISNHSTVTAVLVFNFMYFVLLYFTGSLPKDRMQMVYGGILNRIKSKF